MIFPIPLLLSLLIAHVNFPIYFVKSFDGAQMVVFVRDGSSSSFLESIHEMGLIINQGHQALEPLPGYDKIGRFKRNLTLDLNEMESFLDDLSGDGNITLWPPLANEAIVKSSEGRPQSRPTFWPITFEASPHG